MCGAHSLSMKFVRMMIVRFWMDEQVHPTTTNIKLTAFLGILIGQNKRIQR
jgi:hypothetical protein